MKNLTRKLLVLMSILLIMAFVTSCGKSNTSDQASKDKDAKGRLPSLMTWTAYDVGSAGYVQAAALSDALTKKEGVKVRVMPSGTDVGKLMPLKTGAADFSLNGIGVYFAWKGIYDFATLEWGPQPLRAVWQGFPAGMSMVTAADANIKTPEDLKGKRLAYVPGLPSVNVTNDAMLSYANLTWDDVEKVVLPSYGAVLKGLVEGKVDAQTVSGDTAALFELQSSPRGIYWPEFPPENKEGWARLNKVLPFFIPETNTEAAGLSKDNPRRICTYPYPTLVTYNTMNEETVYNLAKAINDSYDLYKDVNASMKKWEAKTAIKKGMVPYHPGSIRLFKELGLWTPELEEYNNNLLAQEKKWMEEWEKAREEALAKQTPGQAFAKSWMKLQGIEVQ